MRYFVFLFISIAIGSAGIAQSKNDSLLVVKAMNNIIQLCKAGEHGKAAALILYTGKDTAQLYKVVSDYRKKEHRDLVDECCLDIKKYLVDCESKKISRFYTDKDDDGIWQVIELTCAYEDKKKQKITLEFLKINGKLLLGGIYNEFIYAVN